MMRTKALFAFFIFVLVGCVFVYALSSLTIHNTGVVKAVGISIYDENWQPLTSIDWGLVPPNSRLTRNAWLKNDGNVPVTVSMHTENWNPSNANLYMSLTWNLEGVTLQLNDTKYCVFTLTTYANASAISSFSFDIVVVGNE
jgi:hypothetical protein